MKAQYRLATLDDSNRLFDLRRRSITELAPKGMSSAEAESWAESLAPAGMDGKIRDLEIWIAEISKTVVGWGAIRADRIEGLYIAPEFAGQGVGTELLGLIEELMQARGILAAHADASSNSEIFYLLRGYERSGPRTSNGAQPIRKLLQGSHTLK
jgi:putative acetyltransferase